MWNVDEKKSLIHSKFFFIENMIRQIRRLAQKSEVFIFHDRLQFS